MYPIRGLVDSALAGDGWYQAPKPGLADLMTHAGDTATGLGEPGAGLAARVQVLPKDSKAAFDQTTGPFKVGTIPLDARGRANRQVTVISNAIDVADVAAPQLIPLQQMVKVVGVRPSPQPVQQADQDPGASSCSWLCAWHLLAP